MILNIVRDARHFIDEVCIACFIKKKLRERMGEVFRNMHAVSMLFIPAHEI